MAMAGRGARSYKKARTSYAAKARSAYVRKAAKAVVTRMAEKKTHITSKTEASLSTLVPGAAADWMDLSAVLPGDNFYTRDGRQITLQRLSFKGHLHNNATPVKLCRMVIGWIKNQQTPSTVTELFESAATGGTTDLDAQLNVLYRRFNKIVFTPIYDRIIKVGGINGGDSTNTQLYNINLNLRGKKVNFDGATATVADQDHKLYAVVFAKRGDDDEATGSVVEWTAVSHLDFLDL